MAIKREEKALREFKEIIDDLVTLLRKSTGTETAYLYWVNRAREQFVMEAGSTSLSNIMFQDRVGFRDHFLLPHKDTLQIVQLDVGEHVDASRLDHYSGSSLVRQVTVVPFVNNEETVALTVLETSGSLGMPEHEAVIRSYSNALGNVLQTYLELTDLYEQQQEWIDYEESLDKISTRLHKVEILHRMLHEMQSLLPNGGVSLVARGMDCWVNVFNSTGAAMAPALGLMIDEKSICYDALKNGRPEFAIHFNQNPKRLSASEAETDGATLAIPLMIDDRRHGAVIIYDHNALVFKESVKHKLINLARVATLAIRANLGKLSLDEDLLTSSYSSFIPDVWEKALELTLESRNDGRKTWFGFITIDDLQSLRSKYRLEELQRLQRTLVVALNPSRFGVNGYIGFNSDYVFTFLLQGEAVSVPDAWLKKVRQMLSAPVVLSNGRQIEVEIISGYTEVAGEKQDLHTLVRQAKTALSEAVKKSTPDSAGGRGSR